MRRSFFLILAATAAFALLGTGTATPQGGITIWGAASGTHLRLEVRGAHLFVDGRMSHRAPRGCHFVKGRRLAVCSLKRVGSIQVETGDSGDKIEVLDPLPVPLTVYLGRGSDKLIGNAERDICYPQGTPRNRCIGKGGNDICVSAPINTDCVGGPGNDYCKTSDGSDGCWGGPGRDICLMGKGHDGCHGDAGNDKLYGGPEADRLYGGRGADHCDGGHGWGKSQSCEAGPRR